MVLYEQVVQVNVKPRNQIDYSDNKSPISACPHL